MTRGLLLLLLLPLPVLLWLLLVLLLQCPVVVVVWRHTPLLVVALVPLMLTLLQQLFVILLLVALVLLRVLMVLVMRLLVVKALLTLVLLLRLRPILTQVVGQGAGIPAVSAAAGALPCSRGCMAGGRGMLLLLPVVMALRKVQRQLAVGTARGQERCVAQAIGKVRCIAAAFVVMLLVVPLLVEALVVVRCDGRGGGCTCMGYGNRQGVRVLSKETLACRPYA